MKDTNKKEIKEQDLDKINGGIIQREYRDVNGIVIPRDELSTNQSGDTQTDGIAVDIKGFVNK